jgi:hypothetical protein
MEGHLVTALGATPAGRAHLGKRAEVANALSLVRDEIDLFDARLHDEAVAKQAAPDDPSPSPSAPAVSPRQVEPPPVAPHTSVSDGPRTSPRATSLAAQESSSAQPSPIGRPTDPQVAPGEYVIKFRSLTKCAKHSCNRICIFEHVYIEIGT